MDIVENYTTHFVCGLLVIFTMNGLFKTLPTNIEIISKYCLRQITHYFIDIVM